MGLIKEIALFAGGTLFGSAGFKLLTSRDARKPMCMQLLPGSVSRIA